jgi:hypothetical protein
VSGWPKACPLTFCANVERKSFWLFAGVLVFGFLFNGPSLLGAEKPLLLKGPADRIKRRLEITKFQDPVPESERLYKRQKEGGLEIFEFSGKGYDLARRLASKIGETGYFDLHFPEKPKPEEEYVAIFEEFREPEEPSWGQFQILGHLKEYHPIKIKSRNTLRLQPLSMMEKGPMARVVLELKVVDTILGELLGQKIFVGEVRADEVGISGIKKGLTLSLTGELTTKSLEKATVRVIEESASWTIEKIVSIPWRARVAHVEGETVLFEGDAQTGFRVGDDLEVLRPGPLLGIRQMARPTSKIAEIRIEGYQEGYVKGIKIKGFQIMKGDFVQMAVHHGTRS